MQGRIVMMRARGQALIETAFALPVFLLGLFGVVWAIQSGVLGERLMLLARYGGMVSAQSNPFDNYSLYAAYSAANGTPLVAPCPSAPTSLLSDGGPIGAPASASQPFWQPASASGTTTCSRAVVSTAGLTTPKLLAATQIAFQAENGVPSYLQSALGSTSTWTANLAAYQPPTMGALIACYPELQAAFEASVAPVQNPGGSPPAPPALSYPTAPLTMSGC